MGYVCFVLPPGPQMIYLRPKRRILPQKMFEKRKLFFEKKFLSNSSIYCLS